LQASLLSGADNTTCTAVLDIVLESNASPTAVRLHSGTTDIRARAIRTYLSSPAAIAAGAAVEKVARHVDADAIAELLPDITAATTR
jgi:hypothetical protein